MAYSQQQFTITWLPMDIAARAATTQLGGGTPIDFSGGYPVTCQAQLLPRPVAGVGCFSVLCRLCQRRAVVGTTGTDSDPTMVTLPCHPTSSGVQHLPDAS